MSKRGGWNQNEASRTERKAPDDDYDLGDIYRGMREHSQQKRASNREYGGDTLNRVGVAFTSHSNGAHLVVQHTNGAARLIVDYWPGTGLWICRNTKKRKRGIRNLLHHLGVTPTCR